MSARQQKVDELLRRQKQAAGAANDPVAGSIAPQTPIVPALDPSSDEGSVDAGATSIPGRIARDVSQGVRDLPGAIGRGAGKAVNEAAKGIKAMSHWIEDNVAAFSNWTGYLEIGGENGWLSYHRDGGYRDANQRDTLINPESLPARSESVTGQGIESISQFAVGLLGAGKVLKPIKAVTTGGKVVLAAAKGAIADLSVMDPHEERLSNLVAEHSELARPVADLLAAKPGDTEAEARLKNVIEGIGLGLATDAFVGSVKLLRNTRLLKDAPAASKPALEAETEALIKEIDAALTKASKETQFRPVQTPDGQWTIETNLTDAQKEAIKVHTATAEMGTEELRRASRRQVGAPEVPRPGYHFPGDPGVAEKRAAEILKAVAEAAPVDKPLYRGITVPNESPLLQQLEPGKEITFGVSSFSEEFEQARNFVHGRGITVHFELESGAQAVKVTPDLTSWPREKEWVSSGKFEVISSVKDDNLGDMAWVVKIKQIPSAATASPVSVYPRTFRTKSEAVSEAAALNTKVLEDSKVQVAGKLNPTQSSGVIALAKDLASPDNPWMGRTAGIDFSYKNFNTDDAAKAWIESIGLVMRKEIDAARGGAVLTNQQLLERIGTLFPDGDVNQIMSALAVKHGSIQNIEATLLAGKVALESLGSSASRLSKMLDGDPENMILMGELVENLDALLRVGSMTKGIQTAAARATQAGRIPTADIADAMKRGAKSITPPKTFSEQLAQESGGELGLLQRKLLAAMPNLPPERIKEFARKIRLAEGDPSVILKTLKPIADATPEEMAHPKFWDYVNTIWVNSVLSGPLTTIQNLLGTASAVVMTPAEKYFTGVISRNKVMRNEASDIFGGFVASLGDAWTAGKKALSAGRSSLDPEHMTQEWKSPIQGYLGTIVNAPSRFLMSQDAFFKDLSYRAYVRSQGMKEAREMGLTAAKAAEYAENAVKSAFDAEGRGINEGGLDFSRYVTFTNKLDDGTVGKWLQEGVAKHPAIRFAALPFVRTPTNLMLWNWERTPGIGLLARRNREALQAGGSRAAEVWAKQAAGGMVWGSAAYLTLSGKITGNGPSDPELKKQWIEAGHQPYSIKIGNRWVSYRRGDPLLMPVGIIADMSQSSGEIPWEETDSISIAFAAAMARNVSSKSYMYSLTSFMNAAFRGDERVISSYLQNKAASFVPSVANQLNPDDEMHELRGYVDTIMSRIPGMSETLPARRNIFGEPVMKAPFYPNRALNPFTVSGTFVSDSVDNDLLEIGKAIPFPSKVYPGTSVDMTSRQYGLKGDLTPYDRMMQIMANPGHGSPSLRDAISTVVKSPEWGTISRGVPGIQEGGTQFEIINGLVQQYREMARQRVMSEFPKLREAVQQAVVSEDAAKRGGPDALDRVMQYFQTTK